MSSKTLTSLMVDQLESVDIVNLPCKFVGMKKLVWSDTSGKRNALVTFGKKRNVLVLVDDLKWDNIKHVVLKNKKSASEILIDSGDLLVWLKNDYLQNLRILEYGLWVRYFYIKNSKMHWLASSEKDSENSFAKMVYETQLQVPVKFVYSKKKAGYYVVISGNWYFLPRGESLTYYKPGIWNSNYGKIVSQVGYYLEGVSSFIFSNFLKKMSLQKSSLKGGELFTILEKLLILEINYILSKGSRRNKRTKNARARVLLGYGYFLYRLLPLFENLKRLETLVGKLSQVEKVRLNNKLREAAVVREKNILKNLKVFRNELERFKKIKRDDLKKIDLYFSYIYCEVLLSLCVGQKESISFRKIKINRHEILKVAFSDINQLKKQKLIAVSRRALV